MKNFILIALVSIALVGCNHMPTAPEPATKIITEYKYVVRTATSAQKRIPEYTSPIDVSTATQLDLATWITKNEERTLRIEAVIKELIDFYEQQVTNLELTPTEQLEAKVLKELKDIETKKLEAK